MMKDPGSAAPRRVLRGEVYLCDLSRTGGALWKKRPALIVQNDRGNLFSDETIVVAFRSGRRDRRIPVLVPVAVGAGGLDRESLVDAGQVFTLHKALLGARLGRLPPDVMKQVDEALRTSFAL